MMPQTSQCLQLLSLPLCALNSYLSGIVLGNPYLEPRFDALETPLGAVMGMELPDMEPLGMEPLNLEPLGMEPPDMEPLGMEPPDLEPPDLEPLDLEPLGMEPPETDPDEALGRDADPVQAGRGAWQAGRGEWQADRGAWQADRGAWPLPFVEQSYAPGGESLYDHLRFQADIHAFSAREAAVARHMISRISDAGYLEESIEDAAAETGCSQTVAENVLGVIQGFTPAGVGARNLSECLRLQADPKLPEYAMLIRILHEDLDALANRRIDYLARKYKTTRQQVQKLLDYVRTLNPKPGSCLSSARFTPYVIPDATIARDGQQLEVWVAGKASALLSFDPCYLKGVADADAAEFLKQKQQEAVNLINSLNMRSRALELLVGYLAVEQRAFFMDAAAALRPLTQKKTAADLGMSPSTISRCARDKYIATPRGCYSINYFFPSGLEGGFSSAQARDEVGALIALEDKADPLNDLAICEQLSAKGIEISRRTVAKYRAQLGLGGRLERLRYA